MPPFDTKMAHRHKKGLSAKQARQWAAVATSTYAACTKRGGSAKTCEAQAIRAANGVTGSPAAHDALTLVPAALATHAGALRYETFDGSRYLVAPAVAIIAGVLNEHLVAAEEIADVLPSWQGLPVPIGHPVNEWGEPVSANSPALLAQAVGRFFHPRMEGEKLHGEVWLNTDKCLRLGGEALDTLRRIEAGEQIEISTAFYAKEVPLAGVYKGARYQGQRVQLRPDHIALLPNSIGACSIADGCGVLAHSAQCACQRGDDAMTLEVDEKTPSKLRQALRTLFAFANAPEPEDPPKPPAPDEEPPDEEPEEPEESPDEEPEETPAPAEAALKTHLTHDDLRLALRTALQAGRSDPYRCMLHDIEDTTVIYSEGETLYRQAYTVGDNQTVTLSGEPEYVQRVTTYVPVAEPPPREPMTTYQQKGLPMLLTKQELVGRIIAHGHSSWKEDDAPVLLTLEERVLERMHGELEQRHQEEPLTLKALQTELNSRDQALKAEYDAKLATHVQALEEKAERETLLGYFAQRGWTPEETQALPLTALRRMHQELDPVSYLGNGLPRFPGQSLDADLPDDNPKYE